MKKTNNLVTGNILSTLLKLSLPILGTSFIQMAYNMVDMMWVGRLGSHAVAAVGTAGFFTWFGNSLVYITKVGAEIGVSQSIGKEDYKGKNKFIYNSFLVNIIMAIIYTLIVITFNKQLIGFFKLGDANIIKLSQEYLIIVALGLIFTFLNPLFTGIFNASGNSKIPFLINSVGLVFNIVFDPILIFGLGIFPELGVAGAAIATVLAQAIATLLFGISFIRNGYSLSLKNRKYIDKKYIYKVCKYGIPTASQNCLFTFFAMIIGRIIAQYGAVAIAVQKVGSQIEAISWMTAEGFSAALTVYIGQNYGAGKWDRILKGYRATILISSMIGIFATVLFIFFGDIVFTLFIPEKEAMLKGADYLRILGYSQLFMCLEITTTGAFSGFGNTITPSWVGGVFTGLRIPAAILLTKYTSLGIDGVWWSISGSSIVKGLLLTFLFIIMIITPNKEKFIKSIDNLQEGS
ncbi:MATE family efflux transporter [Clostridium isatidis]|uniref:Probable multidrug resistance protein NorM n=1 Tax=Clostridium isatidis TaxID=182773 RepID=A0A343JCA9_9CLOT|nr:MATE family efflux transporter [Clostridium isatidis]ASW43167.1 MATE family efflux transporter [Clostridium isatidis]NLZ34367.1 MATE family efflux transporter [Clostridiales bacterium]